MYSLTNGMKENDLFPTKRKQPTNILCQFSVEQYWNVFMCMMLIIVDDNRMRLMKMMRDCWRLFYPRMKVHNSHLGMLSRLVLKNKMLLHPLVKQEFVIEFQELAIFRNLSFILL